MGSESDDFPRPGAGEDSYGVIESSTGVHQVVYDDTEGPRHEHEHEQTGQALKLARELAPVRARFSTPHRCLEPILGTRRPTSNERTLMSKGSCPEHL